MRGRGLKPVFLAVEEKIGTGILRKREENQVEKFTGAVGSALMVTNVIHTSDSYTDNGDISHIVASKGQGQVKAGIAGHYYLYQGPDPEENGEGLHPVLCPWGHGVELVDLANESYAYYLNHRGEFDFEFVGVIGPPPAF